MKKEMKWFLDVGGGGGGQKVQYIPLGVNEGKFQKKLTSTASVGDNTG